MMTWLNSGFVDKKVAVCDMKKVIKSFAVSKRFFIFADANEKVGGNARFDILHDRLTSFDLAKSGKFASGVKKRLVKLVLYPPGGHGLLYYFCDTTGFPEPSQADVGEVRTWPPYQNYNVKRLKL